MSVVFGPIISRRFGVSLGVDLSPNKKQCNFDCVYCELQPAKSPRTLERFDDIVPLNYLLEEVKTALQKAPKIDVLTITANGEPTLYPYLRDFIIQIKPYIPQNAKSLILSNGSLFGDKNIKEALRCFDIVKFSLDSIDTKSFKKVDNPHKNLSLSHIKSGIESYAKERENMLVCEILVVKNINDDRESLLHLADFLRTIKVDRIDLSTIDRPPAYNVKALSYEELFEISKLFSGLFITLPQRKHEKNLSLHLAKNEVISLLKKRPIDTNEAYNIFDKETLLGIDELLREKIIQRKSVGLIDFYVI